MRYFPRFWGFLLVLACCACTPASELHVTPACIERIELSSRQIGIQGLEPHLFLDASNGDLTIRDDLRVTIHPARGQGAIELGVSSVTHDTIFVELDGSYAFGSGWYDLEITSGTKVRSIDAALLIAETCDVTDAGPDAPDAEDMDADVGAPDGDPESVDSDVEVADSDVEVADSDVEVADSDVDVGCETGTDRCEGGVLETCAAGEWLELDVCAMGCAIDESRCLEPLPSNVSDSLLSLGSALVDATEDLTFDTDTGRITETWGSELRAAGLGDIDGIHFATDDDDCRGLGVFSFEELIVQPGAIVRGVGSRGLVVLTRGPLEIFGDIAVSAEGLEVGAGGYPGGARGEPGDGPAGGATGEPYTDCCDSGAGGGGYAAAGGTGGDSGLADGGSGGLEVGGETLVPLCGGSGGGGEEGPTFPDRGSEGGGGGGAVQLFSSSAVTVHSGGAIRASGGGGSGGHPGGGGGGGAAGAVLVEAPQIEIAGAIVANGGGGGSGGHWNGLDGDDGDSGGSGGATLGTGGVGGDGGADDRLDGGDGDSHSNNGGGGGGAAGRVRLNSRNAISSITGATSPTTISEGFVTNR